MPAVTLEIPMLERLPALLPHPSVTLQGDPERRTALRSSHLLPQIQMVGELALPLATRT